MTYGPGATGFFTVGMVLFDALEQAERATRALVELRQELHLHPAYEFHFNSTKEQFREAFFRAVAPIEFCYVAATINKAAVSAGELRDAGKFYRHACALALRSVLPCLNEATVTVDATGGRLFRRELRTHLLRLANGQQGSKLIRHVNFADSATDSLVQMADMVTGAVQRSFSGKPFAGTHRNCISHRELASTLWP